MQIPDISEWSVPSRYLATRWIDKGAFGIVLVAKDQENPSKDYALKLFAPIESIDPARLKRRFLRGAHFMRDRLEHDHIVRVHEIFGETTESPSFLMDYVPGQDLERALQVTQRPSHLSIKTLLLSMLPIISAVRHAHQRDIIHRDIKPRNILLQPTNPLKAILTDFDLAYHQEDNITALAGTAIARGRIGTSYMHPEFRDNFDRFEDEDSADKLRRRPLDYYSLCAVLFFIVTGEDPLRDAIDDAKLANSEVQAVEELGRANVARLFKLIRQTLRHGSVAETPQNVEDIAHEIRAATQPARRLYSFGKSLAESAVGAPANTATKFKEMYASNSSFGYENYFLFSIALASTVPALLIWYFKGVPAKIPFTPIIAIACYILGRHLLNVARENPDAVPASAVWSHHVRKPLVFLAGLNTLYWLVASGAIIIDPTLKPPFIEFHDELVAAREKVIPRAIESTVSLDSSQARPAPRPLSGDDVSIKSLSSPTRWIISTQTGEFQLRLTGVKEIAQTKGDLNATLLIGEALGVGTPLYANLRLGNFREEGDRMLLGDLLLDGSSAVAKLLSLGLVKLDPEIESHPEQLRGRERAAREHGRGLWAGQECQQGCSSGVGCALKNYQPCPSGWACVPSASSLEGRSWRIRVTGASVDGGLWTNAEVCITAGSRDCVKASQAATTKGGALLNIRISSDLSKRPSTLVRLTAESKTGARSLAIENRQTLLIAPESVCNGFSLFRKDNALVQLFLDEVESQ